MEIPKIFENSSATLAEDEYLAGHDPQTIKKMKLELESKKQEEKIRIDVEHLKNKNKAIQLGKDLRDSINLLRISMQDLEKLNFITDEFSGTEINVKI